MKSHDDIKSFTCEHCGKSWTRKRNRDHHVRLCTEQPASTSASCVTPKTTPSTYRVRKHRNLQSVKKQLPESPYSKANLVKALINSPRTKQKLIDEKVVQPKHVQEEQQISSAFFKDNAEFMSASKSSRSSGVLGFKQKLSAVGIGQQVKETKKVQKARRMLHLRKTSLRVQKEGLRNKLLQDLTGDEAAYFDVIRKARGQKIPETWKTTISDFWTNKASHVTTDTHRPSVRKRIARNQYMKHTRHIMTKSYREAFTTFCKEHPSVKVSEVTFRRLKPFYVRPATARDLEQCCCQKCVSVRKAWRSLMNFRQRNRLAVPVYNNVYDLVNATLCPKPDDSEHHKLECLKQECSNCGIDKLQFDEMELSSDDTNRVTWQTFEYVNYIRQDGKTVKHLDLVKKVTSPKVLVDHLTSLLDGFSYHLFTAHWQKVQWNTLIDSLPQDHATLEMDFSENYTTLMQEEAQSLHWGKTQCAIHSCVIWRPSIPTDQTSDSHVKEHWMLISDDLNHDFHFVQHSVSKIIMPELKKMGCNISVLHQKTDGCGQQYKSKNCFGDISRSDSDLGVKLVANFSASGHGKGEVDQAAGFLKTEARRAVIADVEQVIGNAHDLFQFAKAHLEQKPIGAEAKLHKRRYFFIEKTDIDRNRKIDTYRTIPNTRKLHSVVSCKTDGVVDVRELSCYCDSCRYEEYAQCLNKDYVQPFKRVRFGETAINCKPSSDTEDEVVANTDTDVAEETEFMFDFSSVVCKGSYIAICSSDQFNDYYLFEVESDGIVKCNDSMRSDYQHVYSTGEEVVVGKYFDYQTTTREGLLFKRETKKVAVIPKHCILYVGINLTTSYKKPNLYVLQADDHTDILCSIH